MLTVYLQLKIFYTLKHFTHLFVSCLIFFTKLVALFIIIR